MKLQAIAAIQHISAKVRASGGIRTRQDAEDMLFADAVLLGTSADPGILRACAGAADD